MDLIALAEAGDVAGVLREVETLTPEQRDACSPELEARFHAMKSQDWSQLADEQRVALSSARLGCRTTPRSAADCLIESRFAARKSGWQITVLNLRSAAWRAEVVAHLDEQAVWGNKWFAVAERIVRDTGCQVPTCDTFIEYWINDRRSRPPYRPNFADGPKGADLVEILRNDAWTPTLLPLALERPDVRLPATRVLADLAAEGVIDRSALVRRTFADMADARFSDAATLLEELALTPDEHTRWSAERMAFVETLLTSLLRDGTRKETAAPLGFLRTLALTSAEQTAFLRDYAAMLDLSLPVAAYGQEALIGLDEAGLLEDGVRTEASERVLPRPEKKLVRAQLSWLDRAARRDPARADRVLADVAPAFQHPDTAVQERALNLVARHLKNAGDSVLSQLRAAAEGLGPAHSARAADLLGTAPVTGAETDDEPYAEVLPEPPEPRPVPGPAETPAAVAQEVAAALANRDDVVAFERALDGLLRHARTDRAALSANLGPVMRRAPGRPGDVSQIDLYDAAAAVRGDEPREWHIHLRDNHPIYRLPGYRPWTTPAGALLKARLSEAIELIESGTQPFLLAVPTRATGALDAAVLVERIAELEALEVDPAPIDLAQALLRVDPAPGDEAEHAAGKLHSDAGQQLARWLRGGGLAHQDSTPKGWPVGDPGSAAPGWWPPAFSAPDHEPPLPPVAAALVGAYHPDPKPSPYLPPYTFAAPFWVAQLPHHRDELAARLEEDEQGSMLAALVESGGPAGYALHWAIAWRMDSQRDAAVDALLVLAAQGRLDGGLLAGQLQALMRSGKSRPNRIVDALRAAAETGAYATVWSVLEAALPALLRDKPIRGAGAFLELAVDCAWRCGAKGSIPAVDAVAARTGSTQTAKNARALRDLLR